MNLTPQMRRKRKLPPKVEPVSHLRGPIKGTNHGCMRTFVVEDACDAGGHVVVRFLLAQVFHVMEKSAPLPVHVCSKALEIQWPAPEHWDFHHPREPVP